MQFVHLITIVPTFALSLVVSKNAFVTWDMSLRVITGPVEVYECNILLHDNGNVF